MLVVVVVALACYGRCLLFVLWLVLKVASCSLLISLFVECCHCCVLLLLLVGGVVCCGRPCCCLMFVVVVC